ncbi:MAG TPA: lysylphosphatidylglycerol synthase transmembrane domain-containing protein [Longimicrobiales bacterium]|nr:lysylphosphatidylglycerol synthase transmembrane domain-containing protein [Longimicrobiales bacterium]
MSSRRPPAAAPRPGRGCLDWKSILGLVISAALLYYVFRDLDLREVVHEIASANLWLLALATFFATFVFWIRAWRWKAILEPAGGRTSFRGRFAATTIGFMGNNLLPARIGEFMRAYALARVERLPIVSSFTSLVLERLLDGIFVVSFLFIAMLLPGFPASGDNPFSSAARVVAVLVGGLLVLLTGFVIWPTPAVRMVERVVRYLPKSLRRPIIDSLEAFLAGAGILRNPVLLLRAVAWTGVLWFVNALGFYCAFLAFGLDLGYTAALFFQSAIALGVSIPSAPGFFGTFETAAKLVLVDMWGADVTRAGALAIGFHISIFIPVTLIGLYEARRIGLSLREVKHSEEAVETAVEAHTGIDPDAPAPPR